MLVPAARSACAQGIPQERIASLAQATVQETIAVSASLVDTGLHATPARGLCPSAAVKMTPRRCAGALAQANALVLGDWSPMWMQELVIAPTTTTTRQTAQHALTGFGDWTEAVFSAPVLRD